MYNLSAIVKDDITLEVFMDTNSYSRDTFRSRVEITTQELIDTIQKYDQLENESQVMQFSKFDPLKNLAAGLAEKLRSEDSLEVSESLMKAEHIVRTAEKEVSKPGARKRICAAMKEATGDSLNLLPIILLQLAETGAIVVPFDPTGVFMISTACLVIARVGLASFCAE